LTTVVLLCAIAVLSGTFATAQTPPSLVVEAETVTGVSGADTIVNDASASGSKAAKMNTNGTIAMTTSVPFVADKVAVTAKGTTCGGAYPHFYVEINDKNVGGANVTGSYATYTSAISPSATGNVKIEVVYDNDYKTSGCDRDLTIDKLTLSGSTVVAPPPPPPPGDTYGLKVSASANRSSPVDLESSTQKGSAYIFTSPDTNVRSVDFYLDGTFKRTEGLAPFDFGGGTVDTATALDTKTLSDGSHTIRAKLNKTDGTSTEVSVAFTVNNATVTPPPPTGDPDMTGWTSLEKYNYDRRIKGIDKFFALDTKGVSHSPYIGEINGPNSRGGPHSSDVPQWNALMDKMLGELVKRDSTISGFSVDENQIWGGYSLNSYSSGSDGTSNPAIDTPNEQAPIWEKHVASGKVGHNEAKGQGDLEAGQYAGSGLVRTWAGSAVSPTTGKDTFQYLKDKGYTNVRLGFRWELLQPQLGGSLNTQNLTNFKTAVADARAAGLTVIIEPHNYAWYKVSDSTYYKMGDGRLTGAHLADLWERLSTEFKSDSGVVYDLMNEPGVQGDIPLNGYSSQAKAWEAYAQQSVDAIRANGDTKLIYVPTWRTDTSNAAGYHPQGPWINDPAKNHQYTFHIYFWINGWQNGGNYSLDYPTENNNAKAAGY
jgi:Cellulase (glycosyl hydrolase family 5)/Ca-dependent carbohydrate-binding module xylan-binding